MIILPIVNRPKRLSIEILLSNSRLRQRKTCQSTHTDNNVAITKEFIPRFKKKLRKMYINSKSMPSKNAIRTGFEILNRARLIVLENVLCINSCNFLRRIKLGGTTKDQFVMFLCD